MALILYTDQNGIEDVLSAIGLSLRLDDLPPTGVTGILRRVSRTIDTYCRLQYTPAVLAASDWVYWTGAEIGAYYSSTRRGNPAPIGTQALFDQALEWMKLIQHGSLKIPDAGQRKSSVPVLSQGRIRMFPYPHSRTEKSRSTGTAAGYRQRLDRQDQYDSFVLDYVI